MQLIESYVDLLESDRDFDAMPAVPSLRQAIGELADAAEAEELTTSGAWRISQAAARRLEHRTGYRPPGGWRRLAALAAGGPILTAKRDKFVLEETDVWHGWDEAQTRRELVEAFSVGLVPPTTAAGLFIMLGVHPAWGVHLAHRARSNNRSDHSVQTADGKSESSEPVNAEMFPEATLDVVEDVVFGTVACIVATFRNLDPGRQYPTALLADVIAEICRAERLLGEAARESDQRPGLEPFVETSSDGPGTSSWRVTDFTTGDLLDAWLIPAGAAARHDEGTFSVFPGVFEPVRVGDRSPDVQQNRLGERLTGGDGDGTQVA